MNFTKKVTLGITLGVFANFSFAQSLQEGIISLDSHKFAKAKTNFEQLVTSAPTAENYFYLGNAYLVQFDPNYAKAEEFFNKGTAADRKDFLNKIGIAAVKLAKGNKAGIAEIQAIVADSKEKDPEVLYRAAEALTLFENASSPKLAVEYLEKAIERKKKDIPAYYYYTLGDAYRLQLSNSPQVAGSAMTAYDKALPIAKNKASVFTRMGTLWMAAQVWKNAKESIDKAILNDKTFAPAYKALAAYNIRYQNNAEATKNLMDYSKYADEDPYTQLEIAKLFFTNEDYANSKMTLDKVFDKIDDPIKYKLRAYTFYADKKYAEAQQSISSFLASADKSRVQPADEGLQGLIAAGIAESEKDATKKAALLNQAKQKIAIAKSADDKTLDWDMELLKIQGGGGASQAAADQGPTNSKIEELKKKIAANANDVESIVALGTAYQEAENWNGAILAWDKMIAISPDWVYSYFAKGIAYQQLGTIPMAEASYQKYIDMVRAKPVPEQMQNKETLSYAYYLVAFFNQDKDLQKAKDYAQQAVYLNPAYIDAVELNNTLQKN